MSIDIPNNPAELAEPFADKILDSGELDNFEQAMPKSEADLVRLEKLADGIGVLGQKYFVESRRSISIPLKIQMGQTPTSINYGDGLTFEGEFTTYGIVKIGEIALVGTSVRALCLVFENVTRLPYFDGLPSGHLLYTPIHAVEDMASVA